MYEKLMYKVQGRNNKVIFRLQDFTKNDNVDESLFVEGENSKGDKRLQCNVFVLHAEEFEALQHKQTAMKEHVEDLNNKIMQKNVEIKGLKNEIAKLKRANIDERAQLNDKKMKLQDEKFNILEEHTVEVRNIEKEHQKELDKLRKTHAIKLIHIDETHRETLENMKEQYISRLDKANERFDNEVQANKQASDNLRDKMLSMKETHKDEVVALQKQHHDEMQDIQEKHTYDIDELKQSIAAIQQDHLIEVGKLNEKHHVEVNEMRTKFLKLLSLEHAQDLSDFNECGELPFYIKPLARGFVKHFNEFKKRKELNTPQKIVETYELETEKEKE